MKILTQLSVLALALMLLMLSLIFGQLMLAGLAKLDLSLPVALALMAAIILGGVVDIPVNRIVREGRISAHSLAVVGVFDLWPQLRRVRASNDHRGQPLVDASYRPDSPYTESYNWATLAATLCSQPSSPASRTAAFATCFHDQCRKLAL